MSNDFEMDRMESNFRKTINKKTAQRRREADQAKKKQAVICYIKAMQREMTKETAQDRLWIAFALVLFSYGMYCANAIDIIPLSLTVPAIVVCVSFAFGCVVDSIRLFRLVRKMGGDCK